MLRQISPTAIFAASIFVISRDLFDDKLPVRVDEFLKEALAVSVRDNAQRELKQTLVSIGKTFQEACASYRKDNQQIR